MNNKTILEFGFRVILRIMEISEGVIRLGLRPRRITPSSISIILHKGRTIRKLIGGEGGGRSTKKNIRAREN